MCKQINSANQYTTHIKTGPHTHLHIHTHLHTHTLTHTYTHMHTHTHTCTHTHMHTHTVLLLTLSMNMLSHQITEAGNTEHLSRQDAILHLHCAPIRATDTVIIGILLTSATMMEIKQNDCCVHMSGLLSDIVIFKDSFVGYGGFKTVKQQSH